MQWSTILHRLIMQKSGPDKSEYPDVLREVLTNKRGLVCQESNPQLALCKPKPIPFKSVTLEKMPKGANAKAKEMQEEIEKMFIVMTHKFCAISYQIW